MRNEQDHLGTIELPEESLHGIHTERALNNFPLAGSRISPELFSAIVEIKRAAIRVNKNLGFIDESCGSALVQACNELLENELYHCPLPALQGGAGTSTNLCANEVIANRALQILGHPCGSYHIIHPIETVNLHQSTNDVFPTALRIVVIRKLRTLSAQIARLQGALQDREQAFSDIVTIGRTELQDAVPITVGAQFASFAQAIERDRWRCFKAEERIRLTNLGGTAVGTGLTAPRNYIFRIIEQLRDDTGLPLARADHVMDATANCDSFVEVAGIVEAHAVNLQKIALDLRTLHSFGEISLPQMQAGSSIMPGKVNPVIMEMVIQCALQARSQSTVISDCASLGSLQINEYLPLIAHSITELLQGLTDATTIVADHVPGITANRRHCESNVASSTTIITAFLPHIGYDRAEKLISQYEASETTSLRIFLEKELGSDLVESVLDPAQLMALGYRKRKRNTL